MTKTRQMPEMCRLTSQKKTERMRRKGEAFAACALYSDRQMLRPFTLIPDDPRYPAALKTPLGARAPASVAALGDLDILRRRTLALFCSVKCPGDLILKTYDLAQNLRQTGVTVISGFHSPMERECLTILLGGTQPVILCPARSIAGMRMRAEHKQPLTEGRLLLLSPFSEKQRRITADTSVARNRFVAALADAIFVAYAEPGGKTEQMCRDAIGWHKPLHTFNSDTNANLIAMGVKPVNPDDVNIL